MSNKAILFIYFNLTRVAPHNCVKYTPELEVERKGGDLNRRNNGYHRHHAIIKSLGWKESLGAIFDRSPWLVALPETTPDNGRVGTGIFANCQFMLIFSPKNIFIVL